MTTIGFALHPNEVTVLVRGLGQWDGPGRPTHELAIALGWPDLAGMDEGSARLARSIADGEELSPLDWTRALASAELAFASDVFGAGVEWSTCTGLDDASTLATLRGLQRKLVSAHGPTVGMTLGRGRKSR